MKSLFIPIFCLVTIQTMMAQIDLTTSPAGYFLGSANIYLEKAVGPKWGFETGLSYSFDKYEVLENEYKSSGGILRLLGKYYFNENKTMKGFYLGSYARLAIAKINSNYDGLNYHRLGVGGFPGYKWVTKSNLVLELGLGVGYAVLSKYKTTDTGFNASDWPLDKLDLTGKLSIGYRF